MCKINSIYVHIPFCLKKCNYCAFYSETDSNYNHFVESLIKEFEIRKKRFDFNSVSTIYLGGGTPSLLSFNQLDKIIDMFALFRNIKEFTIEVNPGTINYNKIKHLKNMGVNRLSLGIQSMDNANLTFLNRIHNTTDNTNAFNNARKAGFDNISVDLIIGIPGFEDELEMTLDRVIEMHPEHISVYILTLENNTKLMKMVENRMIEMPSDSVIEKQYMLVCKKLKESGYFHYEISNFTLKGYESKHNLTYWNGGYYIGMGPSATSYFNGKREKNIANLGKYIKGIENDTIVMEEIEELSKSEIINEYIFLHLRLRKGLNINKMDRKFNLDFNNDKSNFLNNLVERELVIFDREYLCLTDRGFLISDYIFSNLIY